MDAAKKETDKAMRSKGTALDARSFEDLRCRITAASGIYVPADETSRFVIERRLQPRLRLRGATSFGDYIALLDGDEMDAMLDAVVIHETYFFREKRQLKVFSEEILGEFQKRGAPIRIWSVGCSTGEEAYTIAMLLAEKGMLGGEQLKIVASDLSRRVLEVAGRGEYTASSFRAMDDSFREKYFSRADRDVWQVEAGLRSSVEFEQFNLLRLDSGSPVGSLHNQASFDIVFCRNVLMYFDPACVSGALRGLHAALKPGGYLLLGHAESLLPLGTDFRDVQFDKELIHRKE
jgi:chemotaxis protein methyltransferase CheR